MIQMFRWDSKYYDKLQYRDMLEDESQDRLDAGSDEFGDTDYEGDQMGDNE